MSDNFFVQHPEVMHYILKHEARSKTVKPELHIDLLGPAGNIFVVVGKAQALLSKEAGDEMWNKVRETHDYKDALDIISSYVDIIDHSYTYFSPGE